jgi:RNA polymerase sigma-70 factor (ECF subfamily)
MSFHLTENDQESTPYNDLRHDEAAFEAFVKQHYRHLCVYCKFTFGYDMDTAEDVANTSFIKLWEVRHTLTDDVSPKSYLYKIAYNTSLNILKHEKVKQQHAQELLKTTSESIEQSNFDSVDLKQLREDIRAAVAELPEQMRRIFEMSKFEGLKYAEIAAQLNISPKTVKTHMSRALLKLREKLSAYYFVCFILLILVFFIKK